MQTRLHACTLSHFLVPSFSSVLWMCVWEALNLLAFIFTIPKWQHFKLLLYSAFQTVRHHKYFQFQRILSRLQLPLFIWINAWKIQSLTSHYLYQLLRRTRCNLFSDDTISIILHDKYLPKSYRQTHTLGLINEHICLLTKLPLLPDEGERGGRGSAQGTHGEQTLHVSPYIVFLKGRMSRHFV